MRGTDASLQELPLPQSKPTPEDAPRYEASIGLVVDTAAKKVRKLPTLYFGPAPLFADRTIDAIGPPLERLWRAVCEAGANPTYCFHPCELDGIRGAFIADMYNRSPRRRRLVKAGVAFSTDPFPRLRPGCEFVTDDWDSFAPRFLIAPYSRTDMEQIPAFEGARLVTLMSSYSMGGVTPRELGWLVQGAGRITMVPGEDPDEACEAIRALAE